MLARLNKCCYSTNFFVEVGSPHLSYYISYAEATARSQHRDKSKEDIIIESMKELLLTYLNHPIVRPAQHLQDSYKFLTLGNNK